jgi:hypothetical protein
VTRARYYRALIDFFEAKGFIAIFLSFCRQVDFFNCGLVWTN